MTVDTATLVAIYKRALLAKPLLFHDVRTPARQEARKRRIRRWMGVCGVAVAADYAHRPRELPPIDGVRWKRAGRRA